MAPHAPDRRLVFWLVAALCAAYASSFAGVFQFDDHNVIVREAGAQSPAAWWASQPGIRPLLKLSYALNRASPFGLAGFHLVNLLVHLGNALLVAALLRRLVPPSRQNDADVRTAAWIAAALFALHPVQTEAVTYLSGRSTSLAAFFALASIVAWQRGADEPMRRRWPVLSLAAFVTGVACKEYVVVVPFALWLCAAVRAPAGAGWWRPALQRTAAHGLVVLVALLAAAALPRYRLLLETSLATRDVAANLATQAHAIVYLIGQLWRLDRLNADPALPAAAGFHLATAGLAGLIAGVVLLAAASLRRHRVPAFALLWFVLWLAPTNSLLARLDVVNDRQLYLALIGPAWALAVAMVRWRAVRARRVGVAVLVLVLGTATFVRNQVYADEVVFWVDVARQSPHNARAFANLGHALAIAGRPDAAREAFDVALQLDPNQHQAAVNRMLLDAAESGRP